MRLPLSASRSSTAGSNRKSYRLISTGSDTIVGSSAARAGATRTRSEVVNNELVRAIVNKRLVEFVDKAGGPRIVEPHEYGIRHGVESLLGFQIGGESQSGTRHGWKQFDVDQISHLRVLERRFAGTRADGAQHHRTWDTLFARVT